MIDIEADGPIPGDYSMVSFAAMLVTEKMDNFFYAELKPISEKYLDDALKVSGFTREQTLDFEDPKSVMIRFDEWLEKLPTHKLIFISDNNGFDWMFICWYFHHFLGKNPFGFSSQNLGSLYKGLIKDTTKNFKQLRKTNHSHHAIDDVKGNVEAFLEMRNLGLKFPI
jgi:hypothetical protein